MICIFQDKISTNKLYFEYNKFTINIVTTNKFIKTRLSNIIHIELKKFKK